MASPAIDESIADSRSHSIQDSDSDYGSDFSLEEALIVERLLSGKPLDAIEDNPIVNTPEILHGATATLRLPRVSGREQRFPFFKAVRDAERAAEQISAAVANRQHYPHLSNQVIDPQLESVQAPKKSDKAKPAAEPKPPDTRSPLERFRTQPKKALSVTDLVSPAWCELQYWYTLTIHGKKRRTVAMKQGSAVHQKLEDQVHTTVPVTAETKEDKWGLRIWNVIQGLRTLRETGQTRELEIWGTVDGLVVNGIIDELTYICPDAELEESLQGPKKSKKDILPTDQVSISEYFKKAGTTSIAEATRSKRRAESNKIYICDVKTRSARTLPKGAAFRPTQMQLMLYHHLLSALATNTVDFSVLTSRYNLDPTATFSDSFIAEVGSLNDEFFYDAVSNPSQSSTPEPISTPDSLTTLTAHNNLSLLWSLMISEFRLTLPDGASSLGNVLKAEYRSRETGSVIGSKTIPMDDTGLQAYVKHEMQWWRGERQAEGVVVEEAFKCRSCDFAEGCEWRLKKIEEGLEKARLARKRRTSNV